MTTSPETKARATSASSTSQPARPGQAAGSLEIASSMPRRWSSAKGAGTLEMSRLSVIKHSSAGRVDVLE